MLHQDSKIISSQYYATQGISFANVNIKLNATYINFFVRNLYANISAYFEILRYLAMIPTFLHSFCRQSRLDKYFLTCSGI